MALIKTAGYYKRLSNFYYEVGALISAGIPILNALKHVFNSSRDKKIKGFAAVLMGGIQNSKTLAESFENLKTDVPEFDRALIDASEKSGRIETCFKFLSSIYQERANLISQFIGSVAYPVFLAHFAVFVFPFAEFFSTGNVSVYIGKTFGILVPLYLAVFIFIRVIQDDKNESWRELLENLVKLVPFFGKGKHSITLARFAVALEALLNAGVSIVNAIECAGSACGSTKIKKATLSWRERLSNSISTPSEEINRCHEFPEIFASQFATGEVSGKLDETLKRLHSYYLEEGLRNLRLGFKMLGHMIFLIIALVIAFKIIMFYSNYYSQYEF